MAMMMSATGRKDGDGVGKEAQNQIQPMPKKMVQQKVARRMSSALCVSSHGRVPMPTHAAHAETQKR
jgi:hypothetical protein